MAAKKTTKSGGETKKVRPTIPSSHARSRREAGEDGGRSGAPEPKAKRVARPTRAGSTRVPATAKRPSRTLLAAPKRTALGDVSAGGRARKVKVSGAASPGGSTASDGARDLAILIAVAGLEKKAVGIEILDVSGKVDYADFLVVMTGRSDRQVSALAQGIEEALRRKGKRALSVEGLPHASWVLMDFGDVVVHVFQDEARSLYDIEGLWMDAKRIPVPDTESDAR